MKKWIGPVSLIVFGFLAGAVAVWKPTETVLFTVATAGYVFTGIKWLYDNNEKVFYFI